MACAYSSSARKWKLVERETLSPKSKEQNNNRRHRCRHLVLKCVYMYNTHIHTFFKRWDMKFLNYDHVYNVYLLIIWGGKKDALGIISICKGETKTQTAQELSKVIQHCFSPTGRSIRIVTSKSSGTVPA